MAINFSGQFAQCSLKLTKAHNLTRGLPDWQEIADRKQHCPVVLKDETGSEGETGRASHAECEWHCARGEVIVPVRPHCFSMLFTLKTRGGTSAIFVCAEDRAAHHNAIV
ncbi:hypothetical protein GOODEAATRI_001580 [Goodea atripinnis]|uniref:Uncharacterized protein n=1 Tax=Goodea atripinnis TaxID=208336 RepID=A0ABV0P0K2_9TELE